MIYAWNGSPSGGFLHGRAGLFLVDKLNSKIRFSSAPFNFHTSHACVGTVIDAAEAAHVPNRDDAVGALRDQGNFHLKARKNVYVRKTWSALKSYCC